MKVFIDVFIGVWALVLSAVWTYGIERKPGVRVPVREVLKRFPAFVFGYFALFLAFLGVSLAWPGMVKGLTAATAETDPLRGIFFAMTFFTIGMASDLNRLWAEGIGRLALIYAVSLFGFIIWIGLAISWLFFHGRIRRSSAEALEIHERPPTRPRNAVATVARGRARRDPVRAAPVGREMVDRVEPDPRSLPPGDPPVGERDLFPHGRHVEARIIHADHSAMRKTVAYFEVTCPDRAGLGVFFSNSLLLLDCPCRTNEVVTREGQLHRATGDSPLLPGDSHYHWTKKWEQANGDGAGHPDASLSPHPSGAQSRVAACGLKTRRHPC